MHLTIFTALTNKLSELFGKIFPRKKENINKIGDFASLRETKNKYI